MKTGDIYVGTSGWSYKGWADKFFPPDLPPSKHLAFYAAKFSTVEINRTFYRLPTVTTFKEWARAAPKGFLYSVKGSRAVTHFKRLRPGAKSFGLLLRRSGWLGEHRGPTLWQLPGTFQKDCTRLRQFVRRLNPVFRHAMEFRHPSWIDDEVFTILRSYNIANVALSAQAMPPCLELTADFAYLRFHGLEGGAAHHYSDPEMRPWADFLRASGKKGIAGFAYFNNDADARAPLNALRFIELIGDQAVSPQRKILSL